MAPPASPAPSSSVARSKSSAPAAPPLAMLDADAGAPADDDGQPPWVQSRHRELHDGADRLLGGELTRAEKLCAARPPAEREACIDAHLAAHGEKLFAEMQEAFTALELLQRLAKAECQGVRAPKAKKECEYGAMDRRLVELEPECAALSPELEGTCLNRAVIRHYGAK